jgi:hypothetical protein
MVHVEADELKIMGCRGQSSHFGATSLKHHVTLTTQLEMYLTCSILFKLTVFHTNLSICV